MAKILIDTDPGQDIDDLLAIWFALRRPELEVLGITTVTHPAADRARLVKRLLRHLGREDIPVAAGMELPLRVLGAEESAKLHDRAWSMNHAAFAEPHDPRDAVDPDGDAVDLIIRTIERHPGEVLLACIAPLTNIACALRRRPSIAGKLKGIALMGGEIALERAEHNVAFDPVAADLVLACGAPVAMGTWDVTRRCVLQPDACARLAADRRPLHRAITDAIARWHPVQHWKPGPVMYDLFPIVWAFQPQLYDTALRPVQVRIDQPDRGRTLVQDGAPIVAVTTGCRAEALTTLLLETLLG